MPNYRIHRAGGLVGLVGGVDGSAWATAAVGRVARMPWQDGPAPSTTFRVLCDSEAIYVQFHCVDLAIAARATELNGPVWQDSCVEMFITLAGLRGGEFVNFEANCCGTFLLGYGAGRDDRRLIWPDLAAGIAVATSVPGPTKMPAPGDRSWWLAARIPFAVLAAFVGRPIGPTSGDVWHGNFYRCGGPADPYACWSQIDSPRPDFHRPDSFGRLCFA